MLTKKDCCHKQSLIFLKRVRDEGIEARSKMRVVANGGSFQ